MTPTGSPTSERPDTPPVIGVFHVLASLSEDLKPRAMADATIDLHSVDRFNMASAVQNYAQFHD